MGLEWQTLASHAQQHINQAQAAPQQQQQQQQRQVSQPPPQAQMQAQGRPQLPGSQTNPIDMSTPSLNTPQLPVMPGFPTNIQQNYSQQQQQQRPPQPFTNVTQPMQQPQEQGQQMQMQQQQQQQGQMQMQRPSVPQSSKPHMLVDWSAENVPMTEDQFYKYLAHTKKVEVIQSPVIEGKSLNLLSLFKLVHQHGGSPKVCNPSQPALSWSMIAYDSASSRKTFKCGTSFLQL